MKKREFRIVQKGSKFYIEVCCRTKWPFSYFIEGMWRKVQNYYGTDPTGPRTFKSLESAKQGLEDYKQKLEDRYATEIVVWPETVAG